MSCVRANLSLSSADGHASILATTLLLPSAVPYVFFFFKQKTAYEMLRSLVGSEMCIRDSIDKLARTQDIYSFWLR